MLLVYDYLLTLEDEVSLLADMHDIENTPLVTGLLHLEPSLDSRESNVPYQSVWKPHCTDIHPVGRGWSPLA
jgi:hypothetical protein